MSNLRKKKESSTEVETCFEIHGSLFLLFRSFQEIIADWKYVEKGLNLLF